MIMLLALPVIAAVVLAQRYLVLYAPSNLLVKRVRLARRGGRIAVALFGLTAVLVLATHAVADAVAAGAPGWLNVLVLVLAWDALKVAWLAVGVALRIAIGVARGSWTICCIPPERRGMTHAGQLARNDQDTAARHSRGSIAPPWAHEPHLDASGGERRRGGRIQAPVAGEVRERHDALRRRLRYAQLHRGEGSRGRTSARPGSRARSA